MEEDNAVVATGSYGKKAKLEKKVIKPGEEEVDYAFDIPYFHFVSTSIRLTGVITAFHRSEMPRYRDAKFMREEMIADDITLENRDYPDGGNVSAPKMAYIVSRLAKRYIARVPFESREG